MNSIPKLQLEVNRIVSEAGLGRGVSSSLDDMVYLGISVAKVDVNPLVADIFAYLGMLGVKGLVENEVGIRALISVIWIKLYLIWYKRDRVRSLVAGILRSAGMVEQANNFERCCRSVYNLECCQCGYIHEVRFHCKLRVCPECGRLRKIELTKAYADALRSLGCLRFMTLTLKNVAELDDGVKRIRACFNRLRHRKFYKTRILGGLYGIEPPVGSDGLWNVHLHVIYAGSFIPQSKLADDWEDVTGDSRVVYIKKVTNGEQAIGYLVKYITKNDVGVMGDKLGEYIRVVYKVRLVQAFGCLLGKKAEKPLFLCPRCGACVWRVVWVETGEVVCDELERLRARASPFWQELRRFGQGM